MMAWRYILSCILWAFLGCSAVDQNSPVADDLQRSNTSILSFPAHLLQSSAPITPSLDIGIVEFDPGVPNDDIGVVAAIRRLESKLLARELREVLANSNHWGVVRIVPSPSALMPLMVESKIHKSNGRDLVLSVRAVDAMSNVWIEEHVRYRRNIDVENNHRFDEVFNSISNGLFDIWSQWTLDDRKRLLSIAAIRYGQGLDPSSFDGFLREEADGRMSLIRLPAKNDPMLARIERIRAHEYLFCDSIDEQFLELYQRVWPTYKLWRKTSLEQELWLERRQAEMAVRNESKQTSRFSRMYADYAAYRSYRIQEQALFDLMRGLEGETRSNVLEVEGNVVQLDGDLKAQYVNWQGILRQLFALEQGTLPP